MYIPRTQLGMVFSSGFHIAVAPSQLKIKVVAVSASIWYPASHV